MGCNPDFSDELGNGLETLILGLIIGSGLWLLMGEKKHGTRGYDTTRPRTTTTTTQTTSTPKPRP